MKQLKLIFTVFFLICLAGTSVWTVEYTEYKNNRFGISFSYPEDWQREEESLQVVVLSPEWAYDGQEKAAFGIQMTPLNYTEEKSLQEYFEELIWENNYTHGEPELVTINERDWFHVQITESENNLVGELYLLKLNNTLYFMVVAYQPPESGARFLEVLLKIVESVRIVAQD
jgi:hypothetical protein